MMFNTSDQLVNSTPDLTQNTTDEADTSWLSTGSPGLEDPYAVYPEYLVARWVLIVYRPICSLFGMAGNILCIVVVMTTSLRHSPMAVYMVTLAFLDWVVSLFAGLTLLPRDSIVGEQNFFTETWHCRVYYFVLLFIIHFDTLTLVSMTTQRFVAVNFPLHAARWNSKRGATLTLVFAAAVAFLANVVHLVTLQLQTFDGSYRGRCSAVSGLGLYVQMRVYPWIDSVIYFFFPFVTISILNVLIYLAIKKAHDFKLRAVTNGPRRTSHHGSCDDEEGTDVGRSVGEDKGYNNDGDAELANMDTAATKPKAAPTETKNKSSTQTTAHTRMSSSSAQLTRMLLTVSMAFLVLTLPLGVFIVLSRYWNPTSGYQKAFFSLIREVTESLMFTNHAINFLLYCLAGNRFRSKVTSVLCRMCRGRIGHGQSRSGPWTTDAKSEVTSVVSTSHP